MNKRHLLGKKGERLATVYYRNMGFDIVSTNYRYGKNEIDLIVKREDLLVFVEVKTRSSELFGYPEEMLTFRQGKRIKLAAEEYIYSNNWNGRIRFDIISILVCRNRTILRHLNDVLY